MPGTATTLHSLMGIPAQEQTLHSAFALRVETVRHWLDQLPRANTGATARAVHEAVVELNRVQLPPAQRLVLLDMIQPVQQSLRDRMKRQHLARPGLSPIQPARVTRVLETMTATLATGYAIAATAAAEPIAAARSDAAAQANSARLLCARAVARALGEQFENLLLYSRRYQAPPPNFWATVHALHELATDAPEQQLSPSESPRAAYLQCLLLGASGTQQLHQRDLEALARHLPGWAAMTELVHGAPGHCVLIVNPAGDSGPLHRSKVKDVNLRWLGIDVNPLTRQLEALLEQTTTGPERALLLHLRDMWTSARTRTFMRVATRETLKLALGLSGTHDCVTGSDDFEAFMAGEAASMLQRDRHSPFPPAPSVESEPRPRDVWDSVFDVGARGMSDTLASVSEYIRDQRDVEDGNHRKPAPLEVHTVNASPRGYCIGWPEGHTPEPLAGEIVGVQRETDDGRWMVGTIRWVHQGTDGRLVGLELLSANAVAYAAVALQRGRRQVPYRALMLPEMKVIGLASTLLTPQGQFREAQNVVLIEHGRERRVRLTRQVAATHAYSRFEFRVLETRPDNQTPAEDSLHALWDLL